MEAEEEAVFIQKLSVLINEGLNFDYNLSRHDLAAIFNDVKYEFLSSYGNDASVRNNNLSQIENESVSELPERECLELGCGSSKSRNGRKPWNFIVLLFLAATSAVSIVFMGHIAHFVSRNTQDLIYPVMRSLRLMSTPIVKAHPVLGGLYEERCLFSNPYYHIKDLDCWPCESVRTIIDLSVLKNFSSYENIGQPFIIKDSITREVSLEGLRKIHSENAHALKDAYGLLVTDGERVTCKVKEFLANKISSDQVGSFVWNINQVTASRILRELAPKPKFVRNGSEVSVHHVLHIDQEPTAAYPIELLEFEKVFVIQMFGNRSYTFIPSDACKKRCKTVSIVLTPRDALFYNWLYWRPVSRSVPTQLKALRNSVSIAYIGSFY